jgi:hypothetical protein
VIKMPPILLLTRRSLRLVLFCLLVFTPIVQAQENRAKTLLFPYYSDAPESCGGTSTLVGSDNAERIYNFFISKGFQPIHAAGIMGNMKAESGLNPKRVQNTQTPEGDRDNITVDGRTGYGLVQWTSRGRQQGLADLAASRSAISGDLSVQLDYIMIELEGAYRKGSYEPLLASTTVEEATNVILEDYERPADISGQRPIRQQFAREFLTLYGGTDVVVGGGAGDASSCSVGLDGCPTGPISQDQTVSVQGILVHPCISAELDRVLTLANVQGLNMSGGGWRSTESQEELRAEHGCGGNKVYDENCDASPPTAIPGESNHERGTAVDFTCDGVTIGSRSHECFIFLEQNTSLINLPEEAWHWSHNGN